MHWHSAKESTQTRSIEMAMRKQPADLEEVGYEKLINVHSLCFDLRGNAAIERVGLLDELN